MFPTSPYGRVTDRSPDITHMNAQLWDFDIDGANLKPAHIQWLENAILRVNKHPSFMWYVTVTGAASLTGVYIEPNNAHNHAVAGERMRQVDFYLKAKLNGYGLIFNPPYNASTLFAELARHPIGVENDGDRSVYVVITTESTPPPIPARPISVPLSKRWAIRYSSGGAASMTFGVDSCLFDIADLDNHIHCYYEYSGATVGVGPDLMPLSATAAGEWTDFATTSALNVADFDGPCRYTSAGGLAWSKNYFTLTPPAGAMTIPPRLDIDTGFTFGVGASVTIPGTGWLKLRSRRPISYSGSYPA